MLEKYKSLEKGILHSSEQVILDYCAETAKYYNAHWRHQVSRPADWHRSHFLTYWEREKSLCWKIELNCNTMFSKHLKQSKKSSYISIDWKTFCLQDKQNVQKTWKKLLKFAHFQRVIIRGINKVSNNIRSSMSTSRVTLHPHRVYTKLEGILNHFGRV